MLPISPGLLGSRYRSVLVPFTWATPSPLLLTIQREEEVLVEAVVSITIPFNGSGPVLLLGTPVTPGRVFDTLEVKPKRVAQFQNLEVVEAVADTTLQLVIAPDGSTAGSGFVLLSLTGV